MQRECFRKAFSERQNAPVQNFLSLRLLLPQGATLFRVHPNMFFKEESERFSKLLKKLEGTRVAVIGHVRPDGDCIGSQVALCRILRSRGIDAVCVNHHNVPYNLKKFVADTPFFHENEFENDGRTAVSVDCGNLSRLGKSLLEKAFPGGVFAAIDHHETNDFFAAEENIVNPSAAATCHLLAGFCLDCGIEIDATLATALYVGLATDTGQFQYPSTTADVLDIAGTLIRHGASPEFISHELYEQEKFQKLELLQRYLATATLLANGQVAVAWIPKDAFAATGTTREDAENFVNYLRGIAGVKIACQLEQSHTGVKGSLRATDDAMRVDLLAKKLNGGGHIRAAGFNLDGADLDRDREKIIDVILQHLEERK